MTPPKQESKPRASANSLQSRNQLPVQVSRRIETNPLLMLSEHWNRLESIATKAWKSGVLPKSIDSAEKAFIVGMKGVELGLSPMYALEHVAVINGKASIDGQAMLRLIYERCPGAKLAITTPPDKQHTECEWEMQRPGQKAMHFRFTLDDAKRAKLLDKPGPWQQYPKAMLKWRALSDGARTAFADVIGGVYLHEEMGAVVDEEGNFITYDPQRAAAAKDVTPSAAATTQTPVAETVVEAKVEVEMAKANGETPLDPAVNDPAYQLGWNTEESQKQAIRLLFQTARGSGWTEEHLRQYMEFQLGKESTKDLTWAELNGLLKHMERNRKDIVEEKKELH